MHKTSIKEIFCEDGSEYLSAGRVGMFTCLLFSMFFSMVGLHYSSSTLVLNYCSLIALQFLGTGIVFYGTTKAAQGYTTGKLVSNPIAVDAKVSNLVSKVVDKINSSQATTNNIATKNTSTTNEVPEKPELEDV